ncbi:unnamed protein product [Brassica napus]|uniref:(rape) hypothetical protein n=2 Tax=Brassica TaxID=3705 RepID=A0A816NAQ3_BRANA|nr:unnamed protein product [Brassica napus]
MSIVVDVNRVSDVTQDENVYERLKKLNAFSTTSQPYSDGERVIALDSSLVSIKGRGRITPLHHVARIGDAELLKDLTIKCETALHIAVKNHQFEAFKVLLGWVQRVNREDILDWKDEDGNTIFHIAALTNQTETALDILQTQQSPRFPQNKQASPRCQRKTTLWFCNDDSLEIFEQETILDSPCGRFSMFPLRLYLLAVANVATFLTTFPSSDDAAKDIFWSLLVVAYSAAAVSTVFAPLVEFFVNKRRRHRVGFPSKYFRSPH